MQAKIFQADSVEAAIKAGLKELGAAQEEVEVEVLQEARKGFLGIGARDAIVKLFVKAADHSEEGQTEAREDADDPDDPVSKSVADPTNEASTSAVYVADDKQARSQQGHDPASDSVEEVQAISAEEAPVLAKDEIQEDGRPLADPVQESVSEEETGTETSQQEEAAQDSDNEEVAAVEEAEASKQASEQADQAANQEEEDTPAEDENDKVFYDVDFPARYIIDVCEAYGVDVTVDVEDHDREIIYHINTDKPGLVIGKHGKILNSLEALAKVLVHRHVRNRVNVVVNVGDYRERRLKTLERLAERTADEVTVKQSSVQLSPLPANERKIVHQALSKYDHIETRSEGREPHRYLIVDYRH
ncbi:RNA-binding cell elongation regulator Jag/EloR [Aerococcus sp. UMB7834]|uniref:RNA-binding cell elongation regulator Jag/EloR n=1 Tax=Aerococcus sp. UMB7834 TaxID=3046342 RepID=UPI00254F13CD|nr:RNA-binding cell elongation regulator Jag/EloR [Aerococcus sp. UMB7834]MDK6805647.1 RNA-binding cell elongation regulator Jag/EloR [Aerococcus sp. UMB7834]